MGDHELTQARHPLIEKGFRPVLYIKHRTTRTMIQTHATTAHDTHTQGEIQRCRAPPHHPNDYQATTNARGRTAWSHQRPPPPRGGETGTTEPGLQDGASKKGTTTIAATIRSQRSGFHPEQLEGERPLRRSLQEGYGVHGRCHRRPIQDWADSAPLQLNYHCTGTIALISTIHCNLMVFLNPVNQWKQKPISS